MARRAVIRSSLLSPPSYYEAVHDGRGPTSPEYPFFSGWYHYMGQEPLSYKRRGGIVDQRDVIMAHQAHKIHNTPQAKRKEWDGTSNENGIDILNRGYLHKYVQERTSAWVQKSTWISLKKVKNLFWRPWGSWKLKTEFCSATGIEVMLTITTDVNVPNSTSLLHLEYSSAMCAMTCSIFQPNMAFAENAESLDSFTWECFDWGRLY